MKNDADLYYSLKTKEKELLQFLIERNQPEFTPIDISRETGISNRTIINRLKRLEAYGFVDPVLVKERVRSYRLTRNAKNRRGVNTKKETAVDYAVNVVNAEKLLQQLIIEGFSGQELIEEFKVRIRNYDNGTKKFLKEAKEAYKDSDFGESIKYERIPESTNKEYKKNIWDAAIGLQAVDGLKPSKYLKMLAEENISGKKTYYEIDAALKHEYGTEKTRQREADIVSLRIAELLEMTDFQLNTDNLISIHHYLFDGILDPELTGQPRNYNIRKSETILLGDSVQYGDYRKALDKLNKLFKRELNNQYSSPMTESDIEHLSEFTRQLWQIHPFGEGNTRTTAVFIELYLHTLGFEVNNEPFKNNSDYYRNALVRCNYQSDTYNIEPTNEFLNRFYMNLLNNTKYTLDNFDLFITSLD